MAVSTTSATELTQEQVAKILVKPLEPDLGHVSAPNQVTGR